MESSSSPENNSDSDTKDNDKIEYNYINYNISANVNDGIDPYQELITPTPNISTQFPSNAYRDFMNIIVKYNLSNAAGDSILKFIQNYGHCTDVLPKLSQFVASEYIISARIFAPKGKLHTVLSHHILL